MWTHVVAAALLVCGHIPTPAPVESSTAAGQPRDDSTVVDEVLEHRHRYTPTAATAGLGTDSRGPVGAPI